MHAKRRWMAPDSDDIGASSMYWESEMDSSWKLATKCRRRAKMPSTAASTCKVELRVRTERDRLRGKLRMEAATPNYVLNLRPPMTGFGVYIM